MRWSMGVRGAGAVAVAALALAACGQSGDQENEKLRVAPDIAARRAQFVPEELTAVTTHLSDADREALGHLVRAARAVDQIFERQAWTGNPAFAARVAALSGPEAKDARDYYRVMYGPWDRLADFQPFLGHQEHPAGAGFYPADMTKEEFDGWVEQHPGDRSSLTSLTTVVRRQGDSLAAIPYSVEYADLLGKAASELRAAAAVTENVSLRTFLELRADALGSDDYFASDMAWMDLDSPIEVVIGPYETYEDRLFGYKASFEAFVCVAQPEDSARLDRFKQELPYLESNLPIPDQYKNPNRGSSSPIRVVDELYTAGDARAGVQTLAFNLPNDERVREAKGSKKVLLKNVMRAKYEGILVPIAERVLPAGDAAKVDFESFYQFTLHHELAHGLGPGRIVLGGRQTEVRLELKDLYSAFEEAKADVLGVYDIYALVDRGVMAETILEHLPASYTAGIFRSIRFGVTEAHGKGMLMQANYLLGKGALALTDDGRLRPVPERFRAAVADLAHDLLMIEATGDYAAAQRFVDEYGAVPPALQAGVERLAGIPVDIDPVYAVEGVS